MTSNRARNEYTKGGGKAQSFSRKLSSQALKVGENALQGFELFSAEEGLGWRD